MPDKPDDFTKILQFLKFDQDSIDKLDDIKDNIGTLVAMTNWVMTAIVVYQKVVELLGFSPPAKDPVLTALKDIGQRVDQIYGYMVSTAKQQQLKDVQGWRDRCNALHNDLWNLAIARSPENVSALRTNMGQLHQACDDMTSEGYEWIPFIRSVYGYWPTQYEWADITAKSHWIDYASPYYMRRLGGPDVDYPANAELQKLIYDPGYYFGVLVHSIYLYVAALAVGEPVFRSTGHDRERLRKLHEWVGQFLKDWKANMFETKIVGPIYPNGGTAISTNGQAILGVFDNVHTMSNPNEHTTHTGGAPSIPLAFIDPVSGLSPFVPRFNQGFNLQWIQNWDNGYWALLNYEEAVASAQKYQESLYLEVMKRSGYRLLEGLEQQLGQLAHLPDQSEVVHIDQYGTGLRPPPTLVGTHTFLNSGPGDDTQLVGVEQVTLGSLGKWAGKPDERYAALRYRRPYVDKNFRVPIARRQDLSKVQLGYTLRVRLGDREDAIPLVGFHRPLDIFEGDLKVFPDQPLTAAVASKVPVNDVYDSGGALFSLTDSFPIPLTWDEEQGWENSGRVPGRQRIWFAESSGEAQVSLDVRVDYDLDQSKGPRFLGYAYVRLACTTPANFTVDVAIDETVIGEDPVIPVTREATRKRLHLAGDILVPVADYWTDRATAIRRRDEALEHASHLYEHALVHFGPPRPGDPITNAVIHEQILSEGAKAFEREHPAELAELMRAYEAQAALQREAAQLLKRT